MDVQADLGRHCPQMPKTHFCMPWPILSFDKIGFSVALQETLCEKKFLLPEHIQGSPMTLNIFINREALRIIRYRYIP